MYNFRSLSNNPYDFRNFNFNISLPKLGYFCRKKIWKPKIFRIIKCDGERNENISHFRNTSTDLKVLWIALNFNPVSMSVRRKLSLGAPVSN